MSLESFGVFSHLNLFFRRLLILSFHPNFSCFLAQLTQLLTSTSSVDRNIVQFKSAVSFSKQERV